MVTTGFRAAVATRLRREAENSRRAADSYDKGLNASHVDQVADHVQGLELDDQSLAALFNASTRHCDSDYWHPGTEQLSVIANWGVGQAQLPSLDDSLKAVVRAGQTDLIEMLEARIRDEHAQGERHRQEAGRLAHYRERSVELEEQLVGVQAQLAQTQAELTNAVAVSDLLRRRVPPEQQANLPDAEPAHKEPTRRERVEDEPNVYRSGKASGEVVYEVGYTAQGKQRWETTGGDIAEAIKLRDELVEEGKISRRKRPAVNAA
jgi:hypothetical protein